MNQTPPALNWRIWPLGEDPKRAILFAVAVVVALAVVDIGFHEPWLTLLSVLFLFGSLRMFWSPTWYRLESDGVVVTTWFYRVTHRWERFRAVKDDPRGIVLSPFRSDSRLENYRALFLRLPPDSQELKQTLLQECMRRIDTKEQAV